MQATRSSRREARIRAADIESVLAPLEQARNLPAALYADPQVFALDRDRIFRRMWLCVAREEDLPDAGDFVTAEVAGDPILLVRGEDGRARAFHNVCRHRGACLVSAPRGQAARAFRCDYHAWTYGLDGRLLRAPLMEENPEFDPARYPLGAIATASWGGFLFVNLDPDAPGWQEAHADLPDLSRYGLETLRRGHRIEYEVAANWKVLCENYSECYHCALVHPQLNRVTHYRSGGRSVAGACFNGGPMTLNEGMTTLSMSGHRKLPEIPGIAAADRRLVHYFHIYPHLLIGLAPDYVLVHRVWPRAADASTVVCDWLFPAETLAQGHDLGDVVEFWDLTNRQDWGLCEMVQRAATSGGARPGPYHPSETCVHAFDRWYVQWQREALLALAEDG